MKRICYISLVILLAFTFLVGYVWFTGRFKYFNIKSTDLSNENINGVYLNENYDLKLIEKSFGTVTHKVANPNFIDYECNSNPGSLSTVRAHSSKIIGIYTQDFGNKINLNKGITFTSTFKDVTKVYGDNYNKSIHKGEMPTNGYYDITFVDKRNKFVLVFEFIEVNNKLNFISLSKY